MVIYNADKKVTIEERVCVCVCVKYMPYATCLLKYYAIGLQKPSTNGQFFDGGQMTKYVTDNSNSSGVSSIVQPPTFFTPSQIKPKLFESRQNFFLTQGRRVSCLRACFDTVTSAILIVPKPFEGR